jgi:hypothetical protein
MSTDRRILNLPLIASGNVTNNIVLPLDDPSDNLTKKINNIIINKKLWEFLLDQQ